MVELKVSADDAKRIASGTLSPVIRALLHDHKVLRAEVERLQTELWITTDLLEKMGAAYQRASAALRATHEEGET